MVVVESNWPLCWSCKKLGHLARYCLQKKSTSSSNNNNDNINNNNNNNKTTSFKTTLEHEGHLNNPKEEWTKVTGRKTAQKQETHKTIELTVEPATEATEKATTKETTEKEVAVTPTTT